MLVSMADERRTDGIARRMWLLVAASSAGHVLVALCVHWSEALLRSLSLVHAELALALGIGWGIMGRSSPFLGAAGGTLAGAAVGALLSTVLGDQPWWFLGVGPPGQAVTAGLAGWAASRLRSSGGGTR
jgi:hypothetical protein